MKGLMRDIPKIGRLDPFDPEGSGYDYATAIEYGITPDKTGHWPSRVPQTGQILKGRKHETFYKTIRGEDRAGYKIQKGKDGKYYSFPEEPWNTIMNINQGLPTI